MGVVGRCCTEAMSQKSVPERDASTSVCRWVDGRKYVGRYGSPPAPRGSRRTQYRANHAERVAPVRLSFIQGRHLARVPLGILESKGLGRARQHNDGRSGTRGNRSLLGTRGGCGMLYLVDIKTNANESLTGTDARERVPRMAAERDKDEVSAPTSRFLVSAVLYVRASCWIRSRG